jgi:hypothetical protein
MCRTFCRLPARFLSTLHGISCICTILLVPGVLLSYGSAHPPSVRMRPVTLIVEPNPATSVIVQRVLAPTAEIVATSAFEQARAVLRDRPPQWLITNLRLAAYNGLHLVLLAPAGTRSVVYSTAPLDPVLALEVQRRGAFYEPAMRLPSALPSYLNAALPMRDRRDVTTFDRRAISRGGRRAADIQSAAMPR